MATLVSDIINEAFVDLGTIAPGETISSTMQTDAFLRLQQMYSGWSAEQLMVYLMTHGNFTLTAGTATYTLGTGGTLVTAARPVRVTGWSSVSGNFRNGGKIVSHEELHAAAKDNLGTRSVLAQMVAADGNFPSINIRVWPIPDTSPGTLELDYWTPLVQFVAVTDALTLPDGYEAALHFNLAIALAPQYARQGGVPEVLAANAQNSKAVIMQKNAQILGLVPAQQAQAQ